VKKNTAGQCFTVSLVDASTGASFNGTAYVVYKGDNGTLFQGVNSVTQSSITVSGVIIYEYTYSPTQSETNFDYVVFTVFATGAVPQDVRCWTTYPQSADVGAGVTLAASQHVIVDSGTVTTLSTLPAAPTDWLAAAAVKADAVTKIQFGLATPTNITAGTITTVTNLTNAATAGDLTSTMKTSVTAAATAATPTAAAVTTDVGITQAGADKVWGSTTRTLSSFGTLVADTAAAAATAVWAAGTRTLSAFGFTVPATVADKTGYSLSANGVQAVWDALLSALTTTGSIGKKLADWTVNADTSGTTTLLTRLSANRAGYLDNLSAGAVAQAASIPPNFSALGISAGGKINEVTLVDTTTTLTYAPSGGLDAAGIRAAVGLASANLDTQLADLPTAEENAAQTRIELATELARIDVAISSCNATAPDNAGITANGEAIAALQASVDALGTQTDPLATVLPGGYAENTAGALIAKFITPDPATPLSPIPAPPADLNMCRVYGYFGTPEKKLPTGVSIELVLVTAVAIKSNRIIVGREVTVKIVNGALTHEGNLFIDLERNDLLTPDNSHWTVTCLSVGFNKVEFILDGPLFDLASLIE
jgi:hypothetical protein